MLLARMITFAQTDTSRQELPPTVPFQGAEDHPPEFPGGYQAMYSFVADNLRYPEEAKARGINGRVYVEFVVEPDGVLSGFKVLRGVDPLLDAEALRVVRIMPKWTPGEQDGKAVRCRMTVPMKFELH